MRIPPLSTWPMAIGIAIPDSRPARPSEPVNEEDGRNVTANRRAGKAQRLGIATFLLLAALVFFMVNQLPWYHTFPGGVHHGFYSWGVETTNPPGGDRVAVDWSFFIVTDELSVAQSASEDRLQVPWFYLNSGVAFMSTGVACLASAAVALSRHVQIRHLRLGLAGLFVGQVALVVLFWIMHASALDHDAGKWFLGPGFSFQIQAGGPGVGRVAMLLGVALTLVALVFAFVKSGFTPTDGPRVPVRPLESRALQLDD